MLKVNYDLKNNILIFTAESGRRYAWDVVDGYFYADAFPSIECVTVAECERVTAEYEAMREALADVVTIYADDATPLQFPQDVDSAAFFKVSGREGMQAFMDATYTLAKFYSVKPYYGNLDNSASVYLFTCDQYGTLKQVDPAIVNILTAKL
jgi:hypothetical protein